MNLFNSNMSFIVFSPHTKITKKLEYKIYLPKPVFDFELFPLTSFGVLDSWLLLTKFFCTTIFLSFETDIGYSETLVTFDLAALDLLGDIEPALCVSCGLLPKTDFFPSGDCLSEESWIFFFLSHPWVVSDFFTVDTFSEDGITTGVGGLFYLLYYFFSILSGVSPFSTMVDLLWVSPPSWTFELRLFEDYRWLIAKADYAGTFYFDLSSFDLS
jgi:hypothetical protein